MGVGSRNLSSSFSAGGLSSSLAANSYRSLGITDGSDGGDGSVQHSCILHWEEEALAPPPAAAATHEFLDFDREVKAVNASSFLFSSVATWFLQKKLLRPKIFFS